MSTKRSNGVRHKYRDLLLLQQLATVAYEDYEEKRDWQQQAKVCFREMSKAMVIHFILREGRA